MPVILLEALPTTALLVYILRNRTFNLFIAVNSPAIPPQQQIRASRRVITARAISTIRNQWSGNKWSFLVWKLRKTFSDGVAVRVEVGWINDYNRTNWGKTIWFWWVVSAFAILAVCGNSNICLLSFVLVNIYFSNIRWWLSTFICWKCISSSVSVCSW